jgi:hypothetical protein
VRDHNLAHAPYPTAARCSRRSSAGSPTPVARDRALAVPLRHRPVAAELLRPALRPAHRDGVRRRATATAPTSTSATAITSSGSCRRSSSAAGLPVPGRPHEHALNQSGSTARSPIHGCVLPCGRPVGAEQLIWAGWQRPRRLWGDSVTERWSRCGSARGLPCRRRPTVQCQVPRAPEWAKD